MKRISNNTKIKCILLGLSILAISISLTDWKFTQDPAKNFTPMPEETGAITDTWEEESYYPEILIADDNDTESQQKLSDEGMVPSDGDIFISEAPVSLSDSTTKEMADNTPPKEKPVTADSLTNPDKKPDYDDSVPLHTETKDFKNPERSETASITSSGQVYDPVFGWIQTGDTNQNVVDSSGDINKQIGTMGN